VSTIRNTLGQVYEANILVLPAKGTRGGILLAANSAIMQLSNPYLTTHTLSIIVKDSRGNRAWMIIDVYGPQGELEKRMFIREFEQLKQSNRSEWLILGDFNLIYKEQVKNNGWLNKTLMSRFKRVIDHLEIKEIKLVGKKYTWSNNHTTPTMSRIDRALCTTAWKSIYGTSILKALSSSTPDHCPILMVPLVTSRFNPKFRFESHWVHLPCFMEKVQ
jgi:hypothetical protein